MNILITGGAGFIGSHTVEAVLAAGHYVRVLDNFSTGRSANLSAGIDIITGDVRDAITVRDAVIGIDAVMHMAALVSVQESLKLPLKTIAVNTVGTANVLEAARGAGVKRVVLASTSSVYGDLEGVQDEFTPVAPISPYGAAKLMAEQWAKVYTTAYALPTVILRYFNVYGPRQPADSPYSGVLALWCAQVKAGEMCTVYGDGHQTRDFVSVHDVAAANLLALTDPHFIAGDVYPVATGEAVSLNEVLVALETATGRPVPRTYEPARDGDIIHSVGSSSHLQSVGWRPQVPLAAGLGEMLA